ncbi:aldo/keto reductase [Methanobrevibacter sp. DSM 116169]|uniref:aldo/keto reductase n=1 Tax=Methanobrevibacter sp. DSM 116169 TaxID=3242727 RepID=UPI0038FC3912
MKYRKIGNTGISASIIGLGTEYLDGEPYSVVEETINSALENGINIFDVFMPGHEVRKNIGKALGKRRKEVIIQGHIGSVDLNQQYDTSRDLNICKRYFENLMKDLGTDYIDIGMLFFIDSDEELKEIHENGIIDYVLNLKEKGIIKAIGASSHNPKIARKVLETGIVDLLMFSINPAFDMTPSNVDVLETVEEFEKQEYISIDPIRNDLYKYCQMQDIALVAMKSFGGGRLLSGEHSPFKKKMSPTQCIHYGLTRPGAVSAMVGCKSSSEVLESIKYLKATSEEKEYINIISNYSEGFKGKCVYCSHCEPCSSGIDIAMVNKYLDIAILDTDNIPPSIIQHYRSLENNGADCTECGSCEKKCPFSVPIIENMKKAEQLLG